MVPEIGHFALILALLLALIQAVMPLAGAARGVSAWMGVARPVAQGQFVFVAIAFGCLVYTFLNNDFSVLYVSQHSNSQLPWYYRITAVWGGHEGSILLWVMILNVWTTAVTVFSRKLPEDMIARVLGVLALISVGFLLFILLTSNPFDRLSPVPGDGQDLNPLLQDPGMIIHPPMLYMGYVGFSVAFAFAIAALLSGRLDASWARWSRPWTIVAWTFLTCGIMLGSWWAYYELGWGGWWFWDPVENASFMPWLVGTALIHSLAVTEKRGSFKSWTVLLAIFACSFSLLGTFLVRSGVLTSVHAFASDPKRGIFILIFLALVIGGSLTLFAWRAPKVGLGGSFRLISRESALLMNNVLLVVAAAAVLLGTLYPLIMDALDLGKISVGPPYFNSIFVPLMAPAVFLMGVGPFARWKEAKLPDLVTRLKWAFGVAVVVAIVMPFAAGRWSPMIALGFLLAGWVAATTVVNLRHRLGQYDGSLWARIKRPPRAYYGMVLAHFGIGVFIVGVTMVKGFEIEKDIKMEAGDTVALGQYVFLFNGITEVTGPNYEAWRGTLKVTRDGHDVTTMYPEKRIYRVQQNPMTESSINTGFTRDLYAALGEPIDPNNPLGAWAVRVHLKPFVDWIWVGCLIMALGGIFALSDRRYRASGARVEDKTTAHDGAGAAAVVTGEPGLITRKTKLET